MSRSSTNTTKRDLLLKLASLDEQIQNIAKKQQNPQILVLDEIQNSTKKQHCGPPILEDIQNSTKKQQNPQILDEIQNNTKKFSGGTPILEDIQNITRKYCVGPIPNDMSNFSVVDSQTQTQFCITRDENISPKSILGYMDLGTPSQIKHSSTLQVMLEKLENENQKLCQELEEAIVRTELQQRLLQEQQKNLEERDKLLETITDMEKKIRKT